MMGKIPSLLLQMGRCQRKIADESSDLQHQGYALLLSSYHVHHAVQVSLSSGEKCSQSEEWTNEAVKEAKEIATYFYEDYLLKVKDQQIRLQEAIRFSFHTNTVVSQGHPFHDVTILIHKEVAFLAFDLASEFLKGKDFQGGRQHLQAMLTSIEKIKDSYALKENEDAEMAKELRTLREDYLISCDIAQALEGLESGQLLYSQAKKDLESNDVEYALNKGWDALDKLKEVDKLAQSTMDDASLQAKAGQGLIYIDVFKMKEKSKKILEAVVTQTAFQDFPWYFEAQQRLEAMATSDPGSPSVKRLYLIISLFQVSREKRSWRNSGQN